MKTIRLINTITICLIASTPGITYADDSTQNNSTMKERMAEGAYKILAENNTLSKPVVSAWELKTMKSEGGKTTEVVESWKVQTRKFSKLKPTNDTP